MLLTGGDEMIVKVQAHRVADEPVEAAEAIEGEGEGEEPAEGEEAAAETEEAPES